MDAVLQWGVNLIVTIQQIHGPTLDSLFRIITFVGDENFYLLFLPLLLWCVDFRMGARLAILFLLSSYLNICLKDLFQQPRPFDINPNVGLSPEEGYGLPSYHAQSALIVWGGLSVWAHKRWLWITGIVLIILVGFSRIYLGVHFPTDILAGWMLGVVLLGIYLALAARLEKRLVNFNLWVQILVALVPPVALMLIHPVKDVASATGTLAGFGVGLALTHRYVSFDIRGTWWQRTLRFLVGSLIVFALYLGLKVVFPGEGSAVYLPFRFVHYGLIGIWISLGAPWLFRPLRLASSSEA